MSIRLTQLAFLILLFLACAVDAQDESAAAIVGRFYPEQLVDLSARSATPLDRRQCFAVYDTMPNGAPATIIAAYTNGVTGAIRVLRAISSGTFQVVAEPAGLDFYGHRCEVELLDIDRDGRRDVHISFSSNMEGVHWLFQWDGQQLTNLTPVTAGKVGDGFGSDFANGDFIDVDLDGHLEFVMRSVVPLEQGGVAPGPDLVFRMSGGRFVEAPPLVGVFLVDRNKGAPETDRFSFPLPSGARGPFSMEILNGDAVGRSRVASATVWLNDQEVATPRDFSQQTGSFERVVQLAANNQLAARLQGEPGSRITIVVRSGTWGRELTRGVSGQ